MKVRVSQSLDLSSLLFAVVMDEVTKNVKEIDLKELHYTDDQVLLGDTWEEIKMRYAQWKKPVMENALRVNVKRTKVF